MHSIFADFFKSTGAEFMPLWRASPKDAYVTGSIMFLSHPKRHLQKNPKILYKFNDVKISWVVWLRTAYQGNGFCILLTECGQTLRMLSKTWITQSWIFKEYINEFHNLSVNIITLVIHFTRKGEHYWCNEKISSYFVSFDEVCYLKMLSIMVKFL